MGCYSIKQEKKEMSTEMNETHEIKEYIFTEKQETVWLNGVYRAVGVLMALYLLAYTLYVVATGKSNLILTLSLAVAFITLHATKSAFEQTVDSTIALFDTYMIIKRNNIKYGINDTRSENHTIHYNEVEKIIFNREDNTLTINGMDDVIENKYDKETKMYVAPPTKYKRDYGGLRIKLESDAYISIVKFITDNTPLNVEIR